jgi:hypothetical protein
MPARLSLNCRGLRQASGQRREGGRLVLCELPSERHEAGSGVDHLLGLDEDLLGRIDVRSVHLHEGAVHAALGPHVTLLEALDDAQLAIPPPGLGLRKE